MLVLLLIARENTRTGFAAARFIRHALSLLSFNVLSLAVSMVLAALRCPLVLAIQLAVALCPSPVATAVAAVLLAAEVRATDSELDSAPLAHSSKKGNATLHHRSLGRRALDSALELWEAQEVTV